MPQSSMHEARLVFSYSSSGTASAIHGALAPEAEVAEVPKTRAQITREGAEVCVRIEAAELSALRAALNSYLRWVDAAERAARAVP